MNILDSVILGIVEGLTEFLPVSSTGHLMIAGKMLGIGRESYIKTFEVAIQSGAIIAVIFLYWKRLLDLVLLKKILFAFLPTALIGYIFYSFIKNILLSNIGIVLMALLLGGVLIIAIEYYLSKKKEDYYESEENDEISYQKAFIIGLFQSIAIVPGVSRSASSIIGARLLGISRKSSAEFSFFLAIPTIVGATLFELKESFGVMSFENTIHFLVGFFTSFIVAAVVIKFFIEYIRKHNFIVFGLYRIVIALVLYLIFY